MSNIQIWQGPNGIEIPTSAKEPMDVVPFAQNLSKKEKERIVAAFQIEAYDMASEYAWRKAMVKLKETIATLGVTFLGEMLGRTDFTEGTNIETLITDYTAIQLAEQLGVIGPTAALKLRHANELILHYFSKDAESELEYSDAFSIVKSSVQYILGESDISIALEFSKFRNRLLGENLLVQDDQVQQLINSPLFYLRTVITILLSSIKNDKGARLEHALANLNLLIDSIWEKIGENDKWHIGMAYRDVTAAGNLIAASGLKSALLKVSGFDFVPENLRSTAYKTLAKQVLEVHNAFNNFYNEPAVVIKLISLGSTIPSPALIECMQAYLAVYLGNRYGITTSISSLVFKELSKISADRWKYYFEKVLHKDEVVLTKFQTQDQVNRFKELLVQNKLNDFKTLPRDNQLLYNNILAGHWRNCNQISDRMYLRLQS